MVLLAPSSKMTVLNPFFISFTEDFRFFFRPFTSLLQPPPPKILPGFHLILDERTTPQSK